MRKTNMGGGNHGQKRPYSIWYLREKDRQNKYLGDCNRVKERGQPRANIRGDNHQAK